MAITFKQLMEDQYTSEFKVKKWVDPVTGKTRERKIRPHRVEFDASKLRGEPSQDDDRGDHGMKESFSSAGQGSVKTNNYSWGKMKTVHHGADFSIPLHPEHHEAIAKLSDEQEHKFKDETGRHWVARRKGADVHFQSGDLHGKLRTTVSHASMREETEEDLANELHEVLSKDAKAGDWIHDFVHSTNPKFEGKSKKERIKMALGAYYGKQNEELVGGQKKLDKNHNNKIDAQDLAIIRGKKKEEVAEQAPVAPVPDRKYIKGTPEWKAHKEKSKPINGHPTNMSCEEVELTEANHREFASQGKMHPDMAKHMVVGRNMDFYAKGTGDKISGTVTKNDGKVVHVRADKDGRTAAGEKHIFNIASKLDEALTAKTSAPKAVSLGVNGQPKSTEAPSTDKSLPPFDGPYTTNTGANIRDKSGATHTPMSRARDLARKALQKVQEAAYKGLEKEDKPGKVKTAVVKLHPNGVESETVEGWKDEKKPVKEDVQKVNVPAYLRKMRGDKPLELKDLKRKDTISDPENLRKATGVSEDAKLTYKDFMMLEYESKDGRYVHKGSYGGSYVDPEGADDADDKKPKQQPAVKRGRGRPAGAKSGARKITGTSKLFK